MQVLFLCSYLDVCPPVRTPSVHPGVLLRCFPGPPGQEDVGDLRVGLRPGHEQRLHRSGPGVTTATGGGRFPGTGEEIEEEQDIGSDWSLGGSDE